MRVKAVMFWERPLDLRAETIYFPARPPACGVVRMTDCDGWYVCLLGKRLLTPTMAMFLMLFL